MNRRPGLSARVKLTLSYAGFLLLAGALLLAVVWAYMLRYAPEMMTTPDGTLARSVRLRLAPAVAIALAFLLVFGLLGGWILAGRMLAPLTRIADAARMAADGSLSHRIRLEGPKDEFRELADVFDTMLEQLQSHITEQQRFAANASHELRTPLAISQALLDVAHTDPTESQGELIERLRTVNTRAIDLTEALLLLSRADRKSFTREPVDLSLIAEEATETLLPLAEQRQITLNVTGETTHMLGSAELILQMVTNLVQNAIVHNLPAGGTVTVQPNGLALSGFSGFEAVEFESPGDVDDAWFAGCSGGEVGGPEATCLQADPAGASPPFRSPATAGGASATRNQFPSGWPTRVDRPAGPGTHQGRHTDADETQTTQPHTPAGAQT